ncbi:MAG: AraC family transcriptional regulator [Sandaracinus sp.]|nr:AraC family transcriptional regulator [Sandaracinus sp.]
MSAAGTYALDAGWRSILADFGADPADVLRRAGLPEDLLARSGERLSTAAYFRLWRAAEETLGDPLMPLHVAERLRGDVFAPALFAALCSPDLRVALERIRHYKPLVAPMRLLLDERDGGCAVELEWLDPVEEPPASLVTLELLFFVTLARLGTRERVVPRAVEMDRLPEDLAAYESFLGVPLVPAARRRVVFDARDLDRPFLTSNESMWSMFEPQLRQCLAQMDASATTEARVRAALLEALPAGRGAADLVAKRLGLSKRTLQRRLAGEATSFQEVLQSTREALARHYLERTDLAPSEISFLLGFEEPNSFYRAFATWTGRTPSEVRSAVH